MANMEQFKIKAVIDSDLFIKANNCPRITNPIVFSSPGVPTDDGLLSNTLFGVSVKDRSNIFGYIELNSVFLHPLVYKVWSRMDSTIRDIVWTDNLYKVDSNGDIVKSEDGTGGSGIQFLKDNFDKIKFKSTGSESRESTIKFIKQYKDHIFITKMIVMPPYYRDVLNTKGKVEIGEINSLYQRLIILSNSIESFGNFGLNVDYITLAKIQETILDIYNFLTKEPNLGKKKSIIRRAVLTKTTDYASRLVLTAPNLNVESPDDLLVDIDHSMIPLPAACVNLKPFILFWLRAVFNNLSSGTGILISMNKDNFERFIVDNFDEQFNDERYEHEIEKFVQGFASRFSPVTFKDNKGRTRTLDIKINNEVRPITWCELFYMAAVEAAEGRHVLITRAPIDSYYSQYPTKIRIGSTLESRKETIGNKTYPNYPYITKDQINSYTGNKVIDTLSTFNPYLGAIKGDYDGDQVQDRVIFTDEANKELDEYLNSKLNFIDLGVNAVRTSSNEAIQSMYSLTLILPEDKNKLTNPQF